MDNLEREGKRKKIFFLFISSCFSYVPSLWNIFHIFIKKRRTAVYPVKFSFLNIFTGDEFRKKIRLLFKYFYKNLSITIHINIYAKSEINKKSTRIRVLFVYLYFVIEFHQ